MVGGAAGEGVAVAETNRSLLQLPHESKIATTFPLLSKILQTWLLPVTRSACQDFELPWSCHSGMSDVLTAARQVRHRAIRKPNVVAY